ncbi:hypothetical protein BpHYR1_022505 [Brachionus plicatilis]|uniref:Uncharacterized protein n=1 Tax=Brachionus plicatilis TaxID=10195 RepID=A0A3M7R4G4_BRAPC|nr:hypothetical protein BpHYR1_022505 [Brachionus plicatilis]
MVNDFCMHIYYLEQIRGHVSFTAFYFLTCQTFEQSFLNTMNFIAASWDLIFLGLKTNIINQNIILDLI